MIVSIMQPYFFAYIGYFQLIAQCDIFVFHDDVQYMKGGWVNRNRILQNGSASWITFPVQRGAHDLAINRRTFQLIPDTKCKLLRQIHASYAQAPRFPEVFPFVEEIVACPCSNVADFNINLIKRICDRLGLRTRFVIASQLVPDNQLTGQARVIDLCLRLGATRYVNPVGGLALYQASRFAACGLELAFLKSIESPYPQFSGRPFVPFLSIIDVLMFNSDLDIAAQLARFQLLQTDTA